MPSLPLLKYLFIEPFKIIPDRSETIRRLLSQGPVPARQLHVKPGVSQPTLSRALNSLGDEIIRIGADPSIQYAYVMPAVESILHLSIASAMRAALTPLVS